MEIFHELAVDQDHALAFGLRRLEPGDEAAGLGDRRFVGGIGGIGGIDGLGMDQSLAVESELDSLAAAMGEPLVIGEVEIDSVQDRESMAAGGEEAEPEPRQQ